MASRPPADLGDDGRALWSAVVGKYTLTPHEAVLLRSACRHADMIGRLEDLLSAGLIVEGAAGQPRLSAAVTELRQSRLALSRLLTDLALPADVAEDDEPVKLPSPASVRASKAATARHERERRRLARAVGD